MEKWLTPPGKGDVRLVAIELVIRCEREVCVSQDTDL